MVLKMTLMDLLIELSEEVLGLDKEAVRGRINDLLAHNHPPPGFYKLLSEDEIAKLRAMAKNNPEGFKRFAMACGFEFMTGKSIH